MTAFASGTDRSLIGFDAGWRAVFFKDLSGRPDRTEAEPLTLTRSGYDAQVRVARTSALRAATFELTVDGLSREVFGRIISEERMFVEISLGWRDVADTAGGAFGAAIESMFNSGDGTLRTVVVGRILDVSKSAGDFLDRTTFRGIGEGFHRLAGAGAFNVELRSGWTAVEAINAIAAPLLDRVVTHGDGDLPALVQLQAPAVDASALNAVADLASRGHADGDDRTVPVFFRLDSDDDPAVEILHVGHWAEPFAEAHHLEPGNGLAEVSPVLAQRAPGNQGSPFAAQDAAALEYDLVLLGRADIDVADVVSFEIDELTGGGGVDSVIESVGFSLPGGDSEPVFDVVSVEHTLGPDSGFVTRLHVAPHPTEPTRSQHDQTSAARAIASRMSAERRSIELRMWEIGVVSKQFAKTEESDGRTYHAQRRNIEAGLEPSVSDNRIVDAPLHRDATPLLARPYLTPFAWKKAGLVMPHYPGTRVVDLHYRGLTQVGAIAGCLWPEGYEPPAHNGDWWLCLPTGVSEIDSTDDASRVADPPDTMRGSHDLIDADGARAIHVAGFRITIGESSMPPLGERPTDPPQGRLEITHDQGNARIIIDESGNIEIATDAKLTFRADTIEAHVATKFEVI
ncbi:hypothetical protein [Salinibacterium sp. SWN167]|uniref:hypothetical protein n=1 Tax=Salinibacterium sp. SWN167 TaxID=2792054 RepID=UPI0018CE11D0|nr:hypothetical protein [Salinibacterium sp. SWN167]MBH0082395.1 hypothetical protein [Salinibacterium sp. SWN167]